MSIDDVEIEWFPNSLILCCSVVLIFYVKWINPFMQYFRGENLDLFTHWTHTCGNMESDSVLRPIKTKSHVTEDTNGNTSRRYKCVELLIGIFNILNTAFNILLSFDV